MSERQPDRGADRSGPGNGEPTRAVRMDTGALVSGILETIRDGADGVDPDVLGALQESSAFSPACGGGMPARSGLAEIQATHLPNIKDELSALVAMTDTATHSIMASVETIERLVEGKDAALAGQVAELIIDIFEACSFQDITGQRIGKVEQYLANIESVADSTLAVLGDEPARGRIADRQARIESKDEDNGLLHGPQLEGSGISQDEIDKLLASFD